MFKLPPYNIVKRRLFAQHGMVWMLCKTCKGSGTKQKLYAKGAAQGGGDLYVFSTCNDCQGRQGHWEQAVNVAVDS